MTKIFTSREFNQNISGAKRAAAEGPVTITDRGLPAFVLLTHEEFARLSGKSRNIVELLAMPDAPDFDFDPPKIEIGLRIPDFS